MFNSNYHPYNKYNRFKNSHDADPDHALLCQKIRLYWLPAVMKAGGHYHIAAVLQ
ncbi:MAG TPA: hypothetical protein VL307_18580 [Chitinophagaceae bacterium]|nr:hypothetical protein [Chitinophagaceae bacterium]